MTRITDNQATPATDNQAIVTVGSIGQQDLRRQANEELYNFFATLFGTAKHAASATITKLQHQLYTTGLRYPL